MSEKKTSTKEVKEKMEDLKKEAAKAVEPTDANAPEVAVPTVAVATADAETKSVVRKVKVKFIKDHTFNINTDKFQMKKDQTMKVELHLANTFAQRNIAYILE
jgi:pyridoxine/pyridoxamine 5'-phosphate oxidase